MIERYSGSARFELNNTGQWVSYGQHEQRMRELLSAVKILITARGRDFTSDEVEQMENAFYSYVDEIPGMIEGAEVHDE